MRQSVGQLDIDVAIDRAARHRSRQSGEDQQPVAIIGFSGKVDRRSKPHAGKRKGSGHQPRLDVVRLERNLAGSRDTLILHPDRTVETPGEVRTRDRGLDRKPVLHVSGKHDRRLGPAGQTEADRWNAEQRIDRGRLVVLGLQLEPDVGSGHLGEVAGGAGERKIGCAGAAGTCDGQPARAFRAGRGLDGKVDLGIVEKSGIAGGALRDFPREPVVGKPFRQKASQRRKVVGDDGSVHPACRRAGEPAKSTGGGDPGPFQPLDPETIDLEIALLKPERGIDLVGGNARHDDRPGLDPEVDVTVRQAIDPGIADEQRRERRHAVDIEQSAGQVEQHRRPAVLGSVVVDAAPEHGVAERKFEIGETLPALGQFDLGVEAGRRKAPDRLVDVARYPCGEARRLADRQEHVALEAQIELVDRHETARLERGPAGQRRLQPPDLPARRRRFGGKHDVADRRVAGNDCRKLDVDPPRDRRARHVEQRVPERREALLEGESALAVLILGIGQADLRPVGVDGEARRGAQFDHGLAVSGVRVLRKPGFEAEFRHPHTLMVERELARQAVRRLSSAAAAVVGDTECGRLAIARLEVGGRPRAKAEAPLILRRAVGDRHVAIGLDADWIRFRLDGRPHAHPAVRVPRSGRYRHGRQYAVETHRSVDPPGAGERARRNIRIELAQNMFAAARLMPHRDPAFRHGEFLERDLAGIERR